MIMLDLRNDHKAVFGSTRDLKEMSLRGLEGVSDLS